MTYREEMTTYINVNVGLFGYTPNAANNSTGNPLLDTGTAYVILSCLGEINIADSFSMEHAISSCSSPTNEYLSAEPDTNDMISHDDIIGIVAGFKACPTNSEQNISKYVTLPASNKDWILSTDGKMHWDSWVKPWHKAFYLLASGVMPWLGGRVLLSLVLILDALFNKSNTSDKKLNWLIVKSVEGKSKIVDFAIGIWKKRLKSVFGTMKNVFTIYYGPNHVFSKWINE